MTPSIDSVVAAIMKLRDKRDAIKNKAKQEINDIENQMEKLEAFVLHRMNTDGVSSYKTSSGTVFKSTTDYAKVADWDAVLEFIKEQGAWHLLDKRVNKIAVRGYLEDSQPLPPGIDYGTKIDINVRRPAASE